jgi:hypothetical protein
MISHLSSSSLAWSTRLMAELDSIDQKAKELTAGLTVQQLNWRPAAGAWSIGQCLEHLCMFNEIYLPAISTALVDKPASIVQELKLGWFARWFIRSFIDPSPATKRARAPKKIVPGSRVDLSVLHRFLRCNHDARELIRQASEYDVNRIRFVNPFVPIVRFTVGTGLKITCGHERRHLLQAERVKQSPAFPR